MKTDVLIRIGGLPWSESKVLTDIDPANIGKIAKDAEIEVVKKKNKTVKKKVVKKKKDTNEKTKDSVDVIQCEKHSVK